MTSDRSTPRPIRSRRLAAVLAALAVLLLAATACGEEGRNDDGPSQAPQGGDAAPEPDGGTVRLLAHDSFHVTEEVLASFEERTGIEVEILRGGDANEVVNQAILTKSSPQADVLFGIDNSMLTRAFDEDLFEPYESPELADVDPGFDRDPEHRVTPIDYGDVCVNFDREHFEAQQLPPPASLQELTDERYRDLLVVENPARSSPGLAFLMATVSAFGEDGWQDYWQALRANGVTVADDWEQAYYERFSGGSGEGDKPLVVSYASSPPAEVEDPSIPVDQSPTGAIASTCYRQIEFAGILRGASNVTGAQQLIDFLLSKPFQDDVAVSMYVYPVRADAVLPPAFEKFSVTVDQPLELPADQVAAGREQWVEEWTDLFR